ncbi:MAG: hypothetical protein JW991_01550 [Candidatus Pacebacteria bacterium]|nr:hypothetical protein [Candidatus Paceibacterota bacterium]
MINSDAKKLAQMVKKAKEWVPEHEFNKLLEKTRKLLEESPNKNYGRIKVKKCCWECIFRNPNDTCENFISPMGLRERQQSEWIPIPRDLAELMFCKAWIDKHLARLLLRGYRPSNISHDRLHPKIKLPWNGLWKFSKHLIAQRRGKQPTKHKNASDSQGIKWPEMNSRLKEILVNVGQGGNKEMWSQYQGTLFLMNHLEYIASILNCLLCNPNSRIAEFFQYVIETHGYHYRLKFGEDGATGSELYSHILKLLTHNSDVIRQMALSVLEAIAKGKHGQEEAPKGSSDPEAWKKWAKKEFKYSWGSK